MNLQVLKEVVATIKVPVFPIGGINRNNVGQLRQLDVNRVAVCRDILMAKDVGKRVRELKLKLVNGLLRG